MALLSSAERRVAEALAAIGYCNPFLPERLELERTALGSQFVGQGPVIALQPDSSIEDRFPNLPALRAKAESLVDTIHARLLHGDAASESDLELYQDLVLYRLFHQYMNPLAALVRLGRDARGDDNCCFVSHRIAFWDQFRDDCRKYLAIPERTFPVEYEAEHVLACFYQIERAFYLIFEYLVGESAAMARLRAVVWQSIFTRDMRRYARAAYRHMHDFPTLITGPSGTGKELIARAIGRARYVPFHSGVKSFRPVGAQRKGAQGAAESAFQPVNLAALPPTLIESELFGHRKGAFTGAFEERSGRLECEHEHESIFLDEVGELPAELQVKLLRVLQSRRFDRVGESGEKRVFRGKVIAATNRNLTEEVSAGRFREDFYYRLCADMISAPSLREQLDDRPADLRTFVRFIIDERNVLSNGADEAERLTDEVLKQIENQLPAHYEWPGNFRELEQCVRNVAIRGTYRPLRAAAPPRQESQQEQYLKRVRAGEVAESDLLSWYSTLVYVRCGDNYAEAARRLGIDRRTVAQRVDHTLAEDIRRFVPSD